MLYLKQSTITNVKLGPFVDEVDAVTEQTGLAGSMTVQLSKNGATFAARNSATAIAHDANGWYTAELNATDSNTLGRLQLKVHAAASHLPVWAEYTVLAANLFDSLIGGGDLLQVDVQQLLGVAASPQRVQKNAALNNFHFIMRQSADHITPATGLTVTAQRLIDGGSFTNLTNSVVEVGSGVYRVNLTASELNGDFITLKMSATNADTTLVTLITQP